MPRTNRDKHLPSIIHRNCIHLTGQTAFSDFLLSFPVPNTHTFIMLISDRNNLLAVFGKDLNNDWTFKISN